MINKRKISIDFDKTVLFQNAKEPTKYTVTCNNFTQQKKTRDGILSSSRVFSFYFKCRFPFWNVQIFTKIKGLSAIHTA